MLKQKARAIALGVLLGGPRPDGAVAAGGLGAAAGRPDGRLFPASSRCRSSRSTSTSCCSSSSFRSGGCCSRRRASTAATGRCRSARRSGPRGKVAFGGTAILVLLDLRPAARLREPLVPRRSSASSTSSSSRPRRSRCACSRAGCARAGFNFRTALIVGTGPKAAQFADFLEAHPHWGFRVVGYLDDDNGGEIRPGGPLAVPRQDHGPRVGPRRARSSTR